VSDYQPQAPGGWPAQPAAPGPGQPDYPASYQQAGYGRGGYGPGDGGQTGRRRRRHPVAILVLVLVVLAAIFVIGDQLAKSYAQNQVAQQVQQSAQMSAKPAVSMKGWPFLTQIASHDLKQVDISANNVTADGSKVQFDFSATATGVHLNSSLGGGTADHINGRVLLPFASLTGLLNLPSGSVTLSADPAAGPNAVKASAGIVGSLTGTVKLTSPSQLTIQLSSATGLAALLGGSSSQPINIALPKLPSGLVVQSVSVTSQGVTLTASGSNTTLTQ
jgi:hypothetical protein